MIQKNAFEEIPVRGSIGTLDLVGVVIVVAALMRLFII
jgi:hypothetical protein